MHGSLIILDGARDPDGRFPKAPGAGTGALGAPLAGGREARFETHAPTAIRARPIATSMALTSILVAYDGSKPSEAALAQALDLAKTAGATLSLVCVIPIIAAAYGIEMPPGDSVAETIEAARRMLAEVKLKIEQSGPVRVETTLLEGDPVDQILDRAEKHPPSLIVVGSRGLSEAGRFFLGSVSDGILHHARCSVLVVKSPGAPRRGRGSRAM